MRPDNQARENSRPSTRIPHTASCPTRVHQSWRPDRAWRIEGPLLSGRDGSRLPSGRHPDDFAPAAVNTPIGRHHATAPQPTLPLLAPTSDLWRVTCRAHQVRGLAEWCPDKRCGRQNWQTDIPWRTDGSPSRHTTHDTSQSPSQHSNSGEELNDRSSDRLVISSLPPGYSSGPRALSSGVGDWPHLRGQGHHQQHTDDGIRHSPQNSQQHREITSIENRL